MFSVAFVGIMLLAGFTQGLLGFGFALVSLTALAYWLDPVVSQLVVAFSAFPAMVRLFGIVRPDVVWFDLRLCFVGGVLGMPVGLAILAWDPDWLGQAVGMIVLLVSLRELLRRKKPTPGTGERSRWGLAVGFVSGLLHGAVGIPGPPIVAFANLQAWSAQRTKAFVVSFLTVLGTLRCTGILFAGLMGEREIRLVLFALPPVLVGQSLGIALFDRVDHAAFRKLAFLLLGIASLDMILSPPKSEKDHDMPNPAEIEVAYERPSVLGEGPHWDAERGVLWWVDIESETLCRFDPASGENQEFPVGQHIGFVVTSQRGDLVAGLRDGFFRIDVRTGSLQPITDPEDGNPGSRFNDGKVDPQGRIWAGTLTYERIPEGANLYVLEPDGACRRAIDKVGTSNGLAWSLDGRTLYYVDTATRRVDAFDFDGETGSISNRRPVVHVAEAMGKPDGMTIDREGMLWVALFRGSAITRWNPADGSMIAKIDLPCPKVTSCCFGGPDFDELYVTTARTGMSDEEIASHPLAGSLFRIRPGVAGLPSRACGL